MSRRLNTARRLGAAGGADGLTASELVLRPGPSAGSGGRSRRRPPQSMPAPAVDAAPRGAQIDAVVSLAAPANRRLPP